MPISKLYIDAEIVEHPEVQQFRNRLKGVLTEITDDPQPVFKTISSADDPVKAGKETLFLTRNKGAFVRKCPGTRHYICCDYRILHIGTFCVMDCSYCILQTYFHPPTLQFFVNYEDLLTELHQVFSEKKVCRIGTGEFTDSLIWEQWTDLPRRLILEFAGQSHAVLELKTKTTAVESLKGLVHNRKTIVAWSLNTEPVIRTEERSTASLWARLRAASMCESFGYPLAFHFDPMILYDGCEPDYQQVVHALFSHVSANNIAWISLGSFRYLPSLKPIIRCRFPDSRIICGEHVLGPDGKMRYFKPLRMRLYKRMISAIKEYAPNVPVYFCMEDDEVWHYAMGWIPSECGGLPKLLDDSAVKICGLDQD